MYAWLALGLVAKQKFFLEWKCGLLCTCCSAPHMNKFGYQVFGKPTGKKLTWYNVPNCFIKSFDGQWKWK